MFGGYEIWIIVGVVVLLFGGAAIPKLARNVGKAKGEFERGIKEGTKASKEADAKKDDAEEVAAKKDDA